MWMVSEGERVLWVTEEEGEGEGEPSYVFEGGWVSDGVSFFVRVF